MSHLVRTTNYLQDRVSALESRMQYLEKEEKEQTANREKYARLVHGPRLPREVIQHVVTFVPAFNKLECEGDVYVDGILLRAIFNPSSLLPYYIKDLNGNEAKHTRLQDVATGIIKISVLDDPSFVNSLELRAQTEAGGFKALIQVLQPTKAFHQLKSLSIQISESFDFDELLSAWPPQLQELSIPGDNLIFNNSSPFQVNCGSLRTLEIDHFYPTVGMQFRSSLTRLILTENGFINDSMLDNLVCMLSQLACLEELCFPGYVKVTALEDANTSERIPRVKSASLRSLDVGICYEISVIFLDCYITKLDILSRQLEVVRTSFLYVRDICTRLNSVSFSCLASV